MSNCAPSRTRRSSATPPARAAEIEAEGARAIRALWVVEGSGM